MKNLPEKHGWGFCGSEIQLPADLFKRIVDCYINVVYYAGVAMVGKKFQNDMEVISVDAWKFAFDKEDLAAALIHFYCDALPTSYQKIIQETIAAHPLKGKAPATIPLSSKAAKVRWEEYVDKFEALEGEVMAWALTNLEKIPNALPNFDGEWEDDEDQEDE